jgi:hypothetical protein
MAVIITVVAFSLLHTAIGQTVSLTENPVYQSQRPCVRYCFERYGFHAPGPDSLAYYMNCDANQILNDCFCRPDLQSEATSILSSCVMRDCSSKTADVSIAVGIYTHYCINAGIPPAIATPTEAPTGTQTYPIPATVTVTVRGGAHRLSLPLALVATGMLVFLCY